jgi:hypothetical protein
MLLLGSGQRLHIARIEIALCEPMQLRCNQAEEVLAEGGVMKLRKLDSVAC